MGGLDLSSSNRADKSTRGGPRAAHSSTLLFETKTNRRNHTATKRTEHEPGFVWWLLFETKTNRIPRTAHTPPQPACWLPDARPRPSPPPPPRAGHLKEACGPRPRSRRRRRGQPPLSTITDLSEKNQGPDKKKGTESSVPVLSSPVVPPVVPPVINEPNRTGSSFSGRYPNCPSPKLFAECSVNIRITNLGS